MHPASRLPARLASGSTSARARIGASLLLLGFVVLIPTWLVLPPDDEGLFVEIQGTAFQAKHLFSEYPFWNPWIGFGVPHPFNETLTFHPFVVLLAFASPALSIGVLYQAQLWIGLFSLWAVCRRLGMRTWISALCAVTFALSAVTIDYTDDFWPSIFVGWTLSPLLLLLVLKLLDSERRSSRAVLSVAAGLCAGLMLLDGHAGVFPVFAIAFAAFLAGELSDVRRVWPWLGLGLLVFALATATKILDIALEWSRSGASPRGQQDFGMDWASLFVYPITAHDRHYRMIAFGGPFAVLALVGLVHRRVSQRHANGVRIATVVSFAAWFVPVAWLPVLSGNWFFRDPFTLFAIVLAGLALERLWATIPRRRMLLAATASLQVAVLSWGLYPHYRKEFARALDYLDGRPSSSLKKALGNQPLYAYFEQRPDRRSTRVYMAPGAEDRLWRSTKDYEFAGWSIHGLRLVNGHFRGIDISGFTPVFEKLHGEIRADTSLPDVEAALNVLNIGYVLALPGESVSPSLNPVMRFRLEDGTVIVVYRNPSAWPDAVVLSPAVGQIGRLPARPGCPRPGLLCADFSPVEALRRPGAISGEEWHGTSLRVRLAPSTRPGVLLLSQMYRPGWTAQLSDGRSVAGHPAVTSLPGRGLTAFDLPPGVRSAEIAFRPVDRIALAGLSWATLLLGSAFVILAPLVTRRRGSDLRGRRIR